MGWEVLYLGAHVEHEEERSTSDVRCDHLSDCVNQPMLHAQVTHHRHLQANSGTRIKV